MRRGSFRQHGRPNHLLVLSDVSRALQAEELAAWKRLIRVIGHELNNSLAPITSLAGSLERVVDQDPLPEDWRSDLGRGLQVISSRVEALNRFMGDCSRLAKLPEPTIAPVDLGTCVRNTAPLEKRLAVQIDGGPSSGGGCRSGPARAGLDQPHEKRRRGQPGWRRDSQSRMDN